MFFYKKKMFNIKNIIRISILFFIIIGIWIFFGNGNGIKCKEGLGLYEDRGNNIDAFSKAEIITLQEFNYKGKGFNIKNYKEKNVNDFNVKKSIGETTIKEYQRAKTEAGLKKLHEALTAHKNAEKKKISDSVNNLNKNSTVGKYFKDIHKNIKATIAMIDNILPQMSRIYQGSPMITLYTDLTDLNPELNGVLYSNYLSSTKISPDMLTDDGLSSFVKDIQTTLSDNLKKMQPKLEALFSLSNDNTKDNVKEYLDQLRELNISINKIINLITLIKIEDITALNQTIKDAWYIVNIDQMLDNEVIQKEKRKYYPNAKW